MTMIGEPSWLEQANADPEARRVFEEERLVLAVTGQLLEAMEALGISRKDLAERLGRSKAHVSQLLSGSRNMTLRTLADVSHALEMRADFELAPIGRIDYQLLEFGNEVRLRRPPPQSFQGMETPMLAGAAQAPAQQLRAYQRAA